MRDVGDNIQTFSVSTLDRLCVDDGTARIHVPATREDVLVAVRELGGVEVEAWQRGDGYWAISPPEDSPGRYLIVPRDTGDTDGT
jgi:hypothetical protein